MNPDPWTTEQLEILARTYSIMSPQECAALIGRPLKSVYHKASVLGYKSANRGGNKPGYRPKPLPTLASRPCLPVSKPAKASAKGPGYLPGLPKETARTIYTYAKPLPDPAHTNTHQE